MLGIAINNEFLDLYPDTQLALEQANPFLQFEEGVLGEYSLPFEIPLTPKNLRLTKYAGLLQTRVDPAGQEAYLYANGLQHSVGKIKIEKPKHHLNSTKKGSLSLYYLTGISSFYQDIKEKKLREVPMGGARTFPWTNYNRSGGGGFWQHIHSVVDAPSGSYPYAFYPVINKEFKSAYDATEVVNCMEYNGTVNFRQRTTDNKGPAVIVPFPYLSFVLEQVLKHIGWSIEGDVLGDADFKKITLVNFHAIDWSASNAFGNVPYASVAFDLIDHLPDIALTEFFIWLKNRLGWWYDFDRKNKVIRIKQVNKVALGDVKEFSRYASPEVIKTVNNNKKGFALRNLFAGDYTGDALNLKAVKYQGTLPSCSNLPAAGEERFQHVYLVIHENNYYICRPNIDTGVLEWQLYSYNVYDFVQEGETQDIPTGATTLGSEKYNTYLDFIPRFDLPSSWIGGYSESSYKLHLLFYHGLRNNKAGQPVPFASSGIYDSAGVQVAQWSLAFSCKKVDGTEAGLYDLNWKRFLTTLQSREELECTLSLSLIDFIQLRFHDVVSINHVHMYVKTIKSSVPYTGSVQLECVRI
jgi:hypothetical protein